MKFSPSFRLPRSLFTFVLLAYSSSPPPRSFFFDKKTKEKEEFSFLCKKIDSVGTNHIVIIKGTDFAISLLTYKKEMYVVDNDNTQGY